MSIGNRVAEAIDKMEASEPDGALFAICAAIEATAKTECGDGGRSAYKDFIHSNFGLITDIAFGGCRIGNLNVGYDHPEIKRSSDGLCSIEDVMYHAVRCGLYHEAKLPDNLKFTDERQIRVEENLLVLPASLIYGFIAAVVVSPANAEEVTPKPSTLNLGSFPIPISKLWGRKPELLWLLDAEHEATRLYKECASSAS